MVGNQSRVIVTGSRIWTKEDIVAYSLAAVRKHFGDDTVLVHGDCPKGLDAIASRLWEGWGLVCEPHPARWDKYGKYAGPKRNKEMAAAGADLCLAYPVGESRGTRHCMQMCSEYGIKTIEIYPTMKFKW